MINEVRARAVDVETGEKPGALRTLEPEAEPVPAKPRRQRAAACPTPAPAPAAALAAPQPEPAPEPAFEVVLGGGVLWADEPEPAGDGPRPWTRGLRG